jgi:uncharacterized repeat protein (TIGR01451 family)
MVSGSLIFCSEWTVTVTNNGPDTTTNVTVQEEPDGFSFDEVSVSKGSYNTVSNIWTIGTLTPGESVTMTLIVHYFSSPGLENCAEVRTSDAFDPTSTPGNGILGEDDDGCADAELPE